MSQIADYLIDKNKPVLVTGASGYIASWLVKILLENGFKVNAAVRDPNNEKKISHLKEIALGLNGEIQFFKSDLLKKGSYKDAMSGCELVFHTASPFILDVNDPLKDLVEPAVNGTRNVLEQANETPSVKKVVLTSSVAAIYSDNADIKETPGNILTEEIWNTKSSLNHQPYSYSKTLAEKEAWNIYEKQSKWGLVVINPSLVLGPALNPQSITSESFRLIKQFGDGSTKFGVPKMGFGVVDVRDVAQAHYNAGVMKIPVGRYIVSAHNTYFLDMAKTLLPKFGEQYPIPKRIMPKFLVLLFGPMINKALTRKFISGNVGYPFIADNSKSIKVLKLKYRQLEDTMCDTFQQLIDYKLI
ncbi:MAG: NAD-dependent epimerase/dehydratase family protein [Marinilabiliales bacterium]